MSIFRVRRRGDGIRTDNSKKPTHLSAPAYVEALMTWTQSILDDEKHFPQKIGALFISLNLSKSHFSSSFSIAFRVGHYR